MRHWSLAPLVALALATTGCEDVLFDDPEHVYNGPPMVEFAPVLPAGTYARTITFARTATANQSTNVRVNYVSAAPASAVTGTIAVASTSTAVEGTHYRFTSGRQYTIAPGTNSVDVPIEVLAAGFAAGQSVQLVLDLEQAQGFTVSPNYGRFTLTLRRS